MPLPGVCPRCDYLDRCHISLKVAMKEIGYTGREKSLTIASVKEVLPPLLILMANQPH
jgi:hypothetical protein